MCSTQLESQEGGVHDHEDRHLQRLAHHSGETGRRIHDLQPEQTHHFFGMRCLGHPLFRASGANGMSRKYVPASVKQPRYGKPASGGGEAVVAIHKCRVQVTYLAFVFSGSLPLARPSLLALLVVLPSSPLLCLAGRMGYASHASHACLFASLRASSLRRCLPWSLRCTGLLASTTPCLSRLPCRSRPGVSRSLGHSPFFLTWCLLRLLFLRSVRCVRHLGILHFPCWLFRCVLGFCHPRCPLQYSVVRSFRAACTNVQRPVSPSLGEHAGRGGQKPGVHHLRGGLPTM